MSTAAVSTPTAATAMLHCDSTAEGKHLKAPALVIPVLSPQSTAPGPKTPPNTTVSRKLADMLSPLLRGSKRSSASAVPYASSGTAAAAAQPQTYIISPASPQPGTPSAASPGTPFQLSSGQPWLSNQAPPTPNYHSIPTPPSPAEVAAFKFSTNLSDTGSPARVDRQSPSTPTKALPTLQQVLSSARSPSKVPTPAAAPARSSLPASPFAAMSAVPQPDSPASPASLAAAAIAAAAAARKPMAVFPALTRLCAAARVCALPPSRTVPEPGTPHYPSEMLALSLSAPSRMSRPSWCLADYAIIEKLYKGYASTVYKAFCKASSDVVVLKVYTLAAVCDLYKYQIYREVRLHSGLQHENIVTMHAAWQEGDKVVMVQEYADGADLFSVMQKYGGRLSERLAVQLVLEPFMRVLHYLHSRGIIHRDIKPENILFTKSMVLKLGDFGLAIDLGEEQAVTRAGTLDYMAPEVLRCPFKSCPQENKDNERLQYSAGVDTWAVGIMTYELCVGYPPFYNQTRTETEQQIIHCMPSFPRNMSEGARDFISAVLSKDPARRVDVVQMLQHPWVDGYRSRRSLRASQAQGTQAAQGAQLMGRAASAIPGLAAATVSVTSQQSMLSQDSGSGSSTASAASSDADGLSCSHHRNVTKALGSSAKVRHADGSVFVGARTSGEWRQSPVKVHAQRLGDTHTSLSY